MSHPYKSLSADHFWSRSVAAPAAHQIDPVVGSPFHIRTDDSVATMGSCFAQHLSRFIVKQGMTYFVPENGGPDLSSEDRALLGYGVFSARYGNVYTVRQALQLFDRAYGTWSPVEPAWRLGERWIDPFRPHVEPDGFATEIDLETDRRRHLAAVRQVFEDSKVFVFTLGLTETWRSREDGAIFPVVPGASGGTFDASKYEFVNFGVVEVTADLLAFVDRIKSVNSSVKVLLTVSPVPLIATYSDQHVLTANTYSKSLLRVAAAEAEQARDFVHYFPSYEVITSPAAGNRYFEPDLRSITDDGVAHAMRVFSRHYLERADESPTTEAARDIIQEISKSNSIVCDEEVLDRT